MGKLIYMTLMSLDGYIEDANGNFDWAAPDDEVHAFVNDLARPIRTHLLGRKMHEVMTFWESPDFDGSDSPVHADFARIWQAVDKVVFSKTLTEPTTARTRIVNEFDADLVHELKQAGDVSIGGANLAAHAIKAGLVDEFQFVTSPVIVGSGKRALPDARIDLKLTESKTFESGSVFTRYAT